MMFQKRFSLCILVSLAMASTFAQASKPVEGEEGAYPVLQALVKVGLKPWKFSDTLENAFYLFRANKIVCERSPSREQAQTRCTIDSVLPRENRFNARTFHWTGRQSDRLFSALQDFGAHVKKGKIEITDLKGDSSERTSLQFEDQNSGACSSKATQLMEKQAKLLLQKIAAKNHYSWSEVSRCFNSSAYTSQITGKSETTYSASFQKDCDTHYGAYAIFNESCVLIESGVADI